MASKAAENTGVRNELVSVCDELLRQNFIDKHKYKIIMLQLQNDNNKKNLQKEILIGGSGIFGSIGNFCAGMFQSNAAKQLASTALQLGKTAAKDIGMKAIDVSKTVAIDAVKKLVENDATKLTTIKSQVANVMVPPQDITKK